jgi:CRP-like cAMP-binding protein
MRKRDLAEGETLYAQGDAGDSMFICVEGLLASAITVRGQGEVKVETLRAGQHFGEGTIFKATSRTTTVTAEADSLVYEIERHVIEPLLDVRLDLREQLEKGLKQQTDRIKDSWREARRKKAEDQRKKTVHKSPVKKVVQAFFPGMFEGAKESQEKSTDEK